jgi:hypothetical protein
LAQRGIYARMWALQAEQAARAHAEEQTPAAA